MHEVTSAEYSGLPTKVRKNEGEIKHQKELWIEKIEKKVRTREIETKHNAENKLINYLTSF